MRIKQTITDAEKVGTAVPPFGGRQVPRNKFQKGCMVRGSVLECVRCAPLSGGRESADAADYRR